jgi:hypothetical protein
MLRRLVNQDGFALIMAVGVLGVLTVAGTMAMVYTTANTRSAQHSKASEAAYSLAESGIAYSLSILNTALDPRTGTLLPSTTITYPEGSFTYSGTIDANYIWTITSIGKVKNPSGPGGDAKRTLTRTAEVRGLMSGATVGAWSRIYHDNVSTCLTIDTVTLVESISSRGDLCMQNSAKITGSTTKVSVGDDVTMTPGSALNSVRDAGAGTGWTNSGNIFTNNGSYATNSIAGSGTSPNLDATGFGFTIPSDATIAGISARVERKAASSSRISDTDVFLLKAGVAGGTDKAVTGTWGTSDTYRTYGGSTDLWGQTWTPADVNAANFGLRFKAQATSGTAVVASMNHMEITVYYTPTPSIGLSGTPVQQADVGDTCKFASQSANKPCSATDRVYASTITTVPTDLTKPTIDMAYWYANSKPGPLNNCTGGGSFPGGFDNNTTYNNSRTATDEMTPTGSSYTCQWKNASNNLIGEISWNHLTHVMKVKGTIFVDGDFRFDDDGQLVNYQGRAIIYAAGNIEFDEIVCAGGDGDDNCITNGMQNWDPTQNMLIILSGGDSEYDQGGSQSQSEPSGFQGIVYAQDDCTIHENFHTSGPLICDEILLPSESNGWPTYYNWPDLGTLIEGQMYGAPGTSPDFELVLGGQSG